MVRRFLTLAIFMLLHSTGLALADGEACRTIRHMDADYTVCTYDPAKTDIRIFNADESGEPYGSFAALGKALWRDREIMRFAVNGGMYHYDMSPVGLFIEKGVERSALSTRGGWGNFHLLPNGVFYVGDGKAGVMETQVYAASGLKPDYATQSGPMLVIDGKLHPRFLADSDSFKVRNGVGVDSKGRVVFATSENPVRFYDFGLLYRDVLDCDNALFLDGTISSQFIPEMKRQDTLFPLGTIIAVVGSLP
jgi:uncharacterized protein YigE (DUF2233 family)